MEAPTFAPMLGLQLPTDPRWAALVRQDLAELLTDHAWCEQKAASNAISMIVRHPELSDLVSELTRIAQEELDHFGQVLQKIHARGWTLGPERKDNYVNELMQFVRKDGGREERLVDRLLFSAMIEARSCERFKVLTEEVEDPELRSFYREQRGRSLHHLHRLRPPVRGQGGCGCPLEGVPRL
jgi:tRNA 2-(methylsulfanyl)-N6-isopentenyladenosine37 hydroxylase